MISTSSGAEASKGSRPGRIALDPERVRQRIGLTISTSGREQLVKDQRVFLGKVAGASVPVRQLVSL